MIHRLYTTASTDAAVTFICPDDTTITHVKWNSFHTAPTDGGTWKAELSFNALSQHTTNDIVNVIDSVCASYELLTSGHVRTEFVMQQEIIGGVAVEAGEKLYLHISNTGISSHATQLYIYTTARRASKSSTRRR